jgi:hypothetical protein
MHIHKQKMNASGRRMLGDRIEDVRKGTGTDPCRPEVLREVEIVTGRQGSLPVPIHVAFIALRIHVLAKNVPFGLEGG